MMQRRSISVPVAGGELSVEITGPTPGGSMPVVILLHDLTANGVTWRLVTSRLDPATATLAVDARGRAASSALPGPFGVASHVADVVALLDHFAIDSCLVVGHGTGGHTATMLASLLPDRVLGVVLVDGGLPIVVTGEPQAAIEASLLPVLQRLRTMHVDRDAALLDARQRTPSGAADAVLIESMSTGSVFTASVLHDLGGQPPLVRSRTNEDAVWFDGSELLLDPTRSSAIERLEVPVELLRVENWSDGAGAGGVMVRDADELARQSSSLRVVTVPGVDHEGLVMQPQGADAVSRSIKRVMGRSADARRRHQPGPS